MFPAAFKLKSPTQNSSGQGVIEIVVVLGLAAILIIALVSLSVRSNRSANFARAEDQAARLSQEGMEFIRGMRDSGTASITNNSGTVVDWSTFMNATSGSDTGILCGGACLNFNVAANVSESIPVDSRSFSRVVRVSDTNGTSNPCNQVGGGDESQIKQFTVEVTWTDTSGDHTSTTSSCLRGD